MNYQIEELVKRFSEMNLTIYDVKTFTFGPNTRIAQPLLPYPVFIFPIRGQGLLAFDEMVHPMDTSEIFHLYGVDVCDRKITCEIEGTESLELICLYYRWDHPEEQDQILYQWNFVLKLGSNIKLRMLLDHLWQEWNHPTLLSALKLKAIFHGILAELFCCANDLEIRSDESRVRSICDFLETNMGHKITVPMLCDRYKISQNHLYYLFSKIQGVSPVEYLISCRIEKARKLLLETSLSVQDICYAVGYGDPHYFSRHFKRRTGTSPSELREKFKNCPPNKGA